MLEVRQLTRSYGSFRAVDNVSFSIDRGEIVGLLGHNGAGKTTIMKMISGFLEPDRGSVTVDGITLEGDAKKIQAGLGYLPENLPVYPEMSVADYLDYAADLKGLKGQSKISEIQRAIAATAIAEKLLAPIATLSRGYKQRVGVAQALLGQPKLLILDEPTNGLDPEQTQHMRDLIREIAKEATVILSTHIMQEVESLCSRVLMLSAGKLVVDEQLQNLKQSNQLLLETSLPQSSIAELEQLAAVSGVTLREQNGDVLSYQITTSGDVDWHDISAELADQVVKSGHRLYRIQPELRDLESLFRKVNDDQHGAQEVSHAA